MALGAWPWLSTLSLEPVTRDGAMWIARGSVAGPDWFRWVFLTSHFNVGYRPLTAFSYTATSVVAGMDPWLYRVTDLVLHLCVGLSIYLLWRVLARTAPRWGGLVATALFLAHPLVQQVVPFIPRRSYSLAAAMTQAGLLVLLLGMGRHRAVHLFSLRTVLAGLLLSTALLANEAAVIAVLILPLLVLLLAQGSPSPRALVVGACALPWGLVVLVLGLRSLVLGGLGGYARDPGEGSHLVTAVIRGWQDLGSLTAPGGGAAGLAMLPLGSMLLLAIAAYYLYRGLVEPLVDRVSPEGRLTLVLAIWTLSYMLLYGVLGVWFPRQSYLLLIPLCLLLAWIFRRTVMVPRRGVRLLLLLPQVLLAVHLLMVSPVVIGPDEIRAGLWEQRSLRLQAMEQAIAAATPPATVRLVQPYVEAENRPLRRAGSPPVGDSGLRRGDAQPAIWMDAIFRTRDIRVEEFLYYEAYPGRPGGVPELVEGTDGPSLRLAADRRHRVATGGHDQYRLLPAGPDQTVPLWPAGMPAGRRLYLYLQDDHDGGRLVPLPLSTAPAIP
jgi:hypothetical protein